MLLGADTGFLIALANKEKIALDVWQTIKKEENDMVISTISLNELLVHFYKRGMPEKGKSLIKLARQIPNVKLTPVTTEIAELSAGYRHGLGIPTVDSLILATFTAMECKGVYTTDSHFEIAHTQKIIEVVMI